MTPRLMAALQRDIQSSVDPSSPALMWTLPRCRIPGNDGPTVDPPFQPACWLPLLSSATHAACLNQTDRRPTTPRNAHSHQRPADPVQGFNPAAAAAVRPKAAIRIDWKWLTRWGIPARAVSKRRRAGQPQPVCSFTPTVMRPSSAPGHRFGLGYLGQKPLKRADWECKGLGVDPRHPDFGSTWLLISEIS